MTILVAIVLVCLVFLRPAYAYLDPGTGSYMLQLLIAALLGAAFAVKVFWKNIRIFFRDLFSSEAEHEEAED
jgi:hypothetical protein